MVEINSLAIIDHYRNLDKKDRVAFRQEVLEVTGMAYTSFYNKIIGRTEFSKSELIVISQLINNAAEN